MAKNKTMKTMLKGVAAGFACMMCGAFFPATAIANAADFSGKDNVANSGISRIEVNGDNKSLTVDKGALVPVPAAKYIHANGPFDITDGGKDDVNGITSTVKVVYKGNGETIDASSGSFRAEKVGTYVVTYTVTVAGVDYTYDLIVTSRATEVSFDFEANTESVIPSIYDISAEMEGDGHVVLPLPTVVDAKENDILTAEDETYYTVDGAPAADEKGMYVAISLTNGGSDITIKGTAGNYYIDRADLLDKIGQDIKVVYSFWQEVDGKYDYVASTSKTFTVKENYYKGNDYTLEAEFASTFPDSATVGVKKTLPGVIGTTSSKDSPAGEAVQTHYSIKVVKADKNGKYTTADAKDVTSEVIANGNEFTAKEEGSYKFVYTVKDFYGHEVELSDIILNVKDTIAASVYMYDAGNEKAYDENSNTYASAENQLKTKSVNRNIIMYAIGGTDNMVAKDKITLRREIRNYANITEYSISDYNEYNLIFAPAVAATADEGTTVYEQIVADNFDLRSQMILADYNPTVVEGDKGIKAFLTANNYLLVVNSLEDAKTIATDITDSDDEATVKEKLLAKGYAYIAPQSGRKGTFNNQTYTFYYFAKDNVNKNSETSIRKTIEFSDLYNDEGIPALTFSSDLQAAYLPTDSFTFNVASATDADSRISATTAYRFLDEDKKALASDTTKETINYVVRRVDEKVADKWYAAPEQAGEYKEITSEGWYIDNAASTYTVDLSKMPKGAAYVEIFAFAIDDYGNGGFFNKTVKIADATDTAMPELVQIKNAPDTTFTAPDEITLPTLTFSDAKANFMSAKVAVYRVTDEGKDKVASYGMSTTADSNRELFTVNAGSFRASVGGKYQVSISVVDAGNHSVTTYFDYTVADGETEENAPTIDNISSTTETTTPDKMVYLDPPSISITKNDDYGYIGLEADDDSNTATYYSVSAVSADHNDYQIINNTYFKAGREGTFKLKYTAYLLQYKLDKLVTVDDEETATVAAGKLFLDKNGKLKYSDGTTFYFVYMEENAAGEYEVKANTELSGFGTALSTAISEDLVKCHAIENDAVVTIKVSSVSLSVVDASMDEHYKSGKTEYDVNDKIEIIKPITEFVGDTDVDAAKTTVTITKGSTTLATIKLSEWVNAEGISQSDYVKAEGDKLYLHFKEDGKYTIKYNVKATQGAGDEYSATLSAGDILEPKLEVSNKIVSNKFKVGETMELKFDSKTKFITVSDETTTDVKALLKTLKVEIKYENESYKPIDNTAPVKEDPTTGDLSFKYVWDLEKKGTYTLRFTVEDGAGNATPKTVEFNVTTDESTPVDTKEVMGGVLIGLSVTLLAGVVVYFIVSKVKLDKKENSYKKESKRK